MANKRLDGKVALITGAAQGIGKGISTLFAREGAKLICGDLDEGKGQDAVQEIQDEGGDAQFVKLDVTIEDEWKAAVDAAIAHYGGLDILVNNAGGGIGGTVESLSLEQFRFNFSLNMDGTFLGCKAALQAMREGGAIVNVSSIAALTAAGDNVGYSAAKGAVRSFSRSLAAYAASRKIRSNAIFPGTIRTRALTGLEKYIARSSGKSLEEVQESFTCDILLGEVGDVSDIAYGALFLASDEARYITATELVIDGGLTAGSTSG